MNLEQLEACQFAYDNREEDDSLFDDYLLDVDDLNEDEIKELVKKKRLEQEELYFTYCE